MSFTRATTLLSLGVLAAVGGATEDQGQDLASLLQTPPIPVQSQAQQTTAVAKSEPFIIGLRRESVPIYRKGKVASFKTSYSGVLNVGSPAQEFRVVFDTGSGNIVLPAAECKSEACLVEDRRRFDMKASSTALAVNADGVQVPEGEPCDQVTIGFGTGEITGELTRDRVCFGSPEEAAQKTGLVVPEPDSDAAAAVVDAVTGQAERTELCVEMSFVLAVEMSSQPFKSFRFDGILGLGLDGTALSKQFSAFNMLWGTGLPNAHFGVFLSEGEEEGEDQSQIAMGGVDEKRLLEPLHWAPVAMPEMGYWQVPIKAVRVNGVELDVCKDGTCRGVADTGTSHLGVPAPFDGELAELLTREAFDTLDCRLIEAPEVQIELPGYNLTLHPGNYMRRLPIRDGVSVSSANGVHLPANGTNATLNTSTPQAPSSSDPVGGKPANSTANSTANASAPSAAALQEAEEEAVRRWCRPRLMPVRLPEPLGPKLFIMGEPVLHRYYTVYDWEHHRVGFGLANTRRNTIHPSEITDRRGVLPKEVDMLLMQERLSVSKRFKTTSANADTMDEVVAMVQMRVTVSLRRRTV